MQKISLFVSNIVVKAKKYPLSVFLFLVVWYLSFFSPPQTEFDDVPFVDKWVHVVMYGGTCSVLWIEYVLKHHGFGNVKRLIAWAWIAPIVMSGCIELLQEYCTGGRRNGDWADLAANSIGVTLAILTGIITNAIRRKWLCDKRTADRV